MANKPKFLPIDLLVLDADTQSRLSIHEETVDVYAELIEQDVEWPFPPVDVFHDGNRYMVADGFHRIIGAAKTKRASIPCIVHKGTATDARIFAMTANDKHGLRMSRADKRACVEWLLDNKPELTQKRVSEAAGVTERSVRRIVAERKHDRTMSYSGEDGRTDSDGTDTPGMDVAPNDSGGTMPMENSPEPAGSGMEWQGDPNRCQSCGNNHWIDGKCSNGCDDEQEWEEVEDEEDESPEEQARKVRSVCHQHRDKMVRAIDDYHRQKPNRSERDRLVKLIQGVELW